MTNNFCKLIFSPVSRFLSIFLLGILILGNDVAAESVLLKDGITRTVDSVIKDSPSAWVNCAKELQTIPGLEQKCHINEPNKLVTLRYGAEGSYFFYVFKSVKPIEIGCGNITLGDSSPGVQKYCDYTTGTVYSGLDATGYREVAKEGEQFTVTTPAASVWVRLGMVRPAGGQGYYRLVQGNGH